MTPHGIVRISRTKERHFDSVKAKVGPASILKCAAAVKFSPVQLIKLRLKFTIEINEVHKALMLHKLNLNIRKKQQLEALINKIN